MIHDSDGGSTKNGVFILFLSILCIFSLGTIVIADPYFSPNEGKYPLEVTFVLPGGEACDSVTWSFDDGNSSTMISPSYTYRNMGMYYPECVVTLPGATITYYFDKIMVMNADMTDEDSFDAKWPIDKKIDASVEGLSYEELIHQGDGLLALGLSDYAVKAYQKAIGIDGSDPALIAKYAENLVSLGRMNEAKNAYSMSLDLNPDPDVMVAYGTLLISMKLYAEAEEIFKKALEIDPGNAQALAGLATVYALQGNAEEAAATFEQALSINSQMASAQQTYGDVLMTLGSYEKAVDAYQKAIDYGISNSEIWYDYGNALLKTGNTGEANSAKAMARSLQTPLSIQRGPSGIPSCNIGSMC